MFHLEAFKSSGHVPFHLQKDSTTGCFWTLEFAPKLRCQSISIGKNCEFEEVHGHVSLLVEPRGKPIGFQKFPGFFLDDPIQTPSRQGAGLDQRSMVQTWLGDLEEIATTSPYVGSFPWTKKPWP